MFWGTALLEPGNVPTSRTWQQLSWPVATVLQQWTCWGLGHTRERKGSSGKGVVEPNIMVGPRRGFYSASAMVQLSHGITCQAHNPEWDQDAGISPHQPATSSNIQAPYRGKLGRAVRKLRPARGVMSSTGTAQAVAVTCQLEPMWYKVRWQMQLATWGWGQGGHSTRPMAFSVVPGEAG